MALSRQRRDPGGRLAPPGHGAVTGRRIVQMVKDDLKPSDILTKDAFENAIRVNGAIGGSTNAVIHLLAIAGRVGRRPDARRLGPAGARRADHRRPDAVGPLPDGGVLLRRRPAGGDQAPSARPGKLHKDALTVSGGPIWDEVKDVRNWNEEVIRPLDKALTARGGIAVLRGNLAPDGAVLKPSAASAAPDGASRAGGRLRGHRRLQGEDQRRRARHRRDLRDGAEELRAAWLSRHGRGRQHGAAAEGAAQGHHRHGARSPTRACRAPPTARWCCTPRPRRRAAARSRWCGTAT